MGCTGSSPKGSNDPNSTLRKEKKRSRQANGDFIKKLAIMRRVPILKWISKEHHPLLAAAAERAVFEPGTSVVEQGTIGSAFFIITEGEASVCVEVDGETNQVATLKVQDYFGEQSLMFDQMCNATIRALTKLSCLTITRESFFDLGLDKHVTFPRRKALRGSAPERTEDLSRPTGGIKPNEEQVKLIENRLMNNNHLVTTVGLTETHAKIVAEHFWLDTIEEGKQVIKQGDDKCDKFYIVASGTFEIFKQDDESDKSSEKVCIGLVGEGNSFGEMALICSYEQETTVQAAQESDVWVIDRATFTALKRDAAFMDSAALLDRIQVFSPLLQQEKRTLVEALVPLSFKQGEEVVTQGNDETALYILTEGEVSVIKNGKERGAFTASPLLVQCFGEQLLSNESKPSAATVKVVSPAAKALVLSKDVIETLKESLHAPVKGGGTKMRTQRATAAVSANQARISRFGKKNPNQMALIGVLGVGGFGRVDLRQDKKTGQCFAVKEVSKGFIMKHRMEHNLVNELQIMLSVCSPFIIELYGTNKSAHWIFFFLEPALGGDLLAAYRKRQLYGDLECAKYYSASVALALDHLHERYVIYRDLKPENLLLDGKGHLKLTDMGLATFALGKTYTFCGTLQYFAPEVIQYQGQTRALDWWTLGILIYELMNGSPPFKGRNEKELFANVIAGLEKIPFLPSMGEMKPLVTSLLKKEPSERLPMKPGGLRNLLQHPSLSTFNWEGLKSGRLTPPYVPHITGPTDLKNFKRVAREVPSVDCYGDSSGWDGDF